MNNIRQMSSTASERRMDVRLRTPPNTVDITDLTFWFPAALVFIVRTSVDRRSMTFLYATTMSM